MKLDLFEQEDKSEVAICLLDWCYDEREIDILLKDFLLDYLSKFKCGTDQVLAKYLLHLLDQSSFSWYWNQGEAAPWESSVSTLLKYINDDSLKLDLILAVLRQAPVPWSNQIKTMAAQGCALKDPRTSLLVKEEQLVVVKEMVTKYQAGKSFNRKGREAERLLQRMFQTSGNLSETFQDALRVAQVMDGVGVRDAKLLYVEKLIQNDKVKEAIESLDADDDDCLYVVEMMLIKAERVTSTPIILFLKMAILTFTHQVEHLQSRIKVVSEKQTLNDLLNGDFTQEYVTKLTALTVEVAMAKLHKVAQLSNMEFSTLMRDYLRSLDTCNLQEKIIQVLEHLIEDRVPINLDGLELKGVAKEEFSLVRNALNDDDGVGQDVMFKAKWMHFVVQLRSRSTQDFERVLVDEEMMAVDKKLRSSQFWDKGLSIDDLVIAKTSTLFKELELVKEAQSQTLIDDMDITVPEENFCPQSSPQVNNELNADIFNLVEEVLNELLEKNHVLLGLQFLKLLEWPLCTYPQFNEFMVGNKRANLISTFLTHLLMERVPDLPLALAMLQGECQVQEGLKKLSQLNLGTNAKLVNLARLGSRYCSRWNLRAQKNQFLNLLMSTLWSNELNIKGTTLASLDQGNPEYLQILSSYLLSGKDEYIIANLLKYAQAFGLAASTLMELLIKTKLKTKEGIKNELLDNAFRHIPQEQQESLIQELILMTSPYDYALLKHLFEILQDERNR